MKMNEERKALFIKVLAIVRKNPSLGAYNIADTLGVDRIKVNNLFIEYKLSDQEQRHEFAARAAFASEGADLTEFLPKYNDIDPGVLKRLVLARVKENHKLSADKIAAELGVSAGRVKRLLNINGLGSKAQRHEFAERAASANKGADLTELLPKYNDIDLGVLKRLVLARVKEDYTLTADRIATELGVNTERVKKFLDRNGLGSKKKRRNLPKEQHLLAKVLTLRSFCRKL